MRTVKRAATPRVVKQAQRSLHPVSNAIYSAQCPLNTKPGKRKAARDTTAPVASVRTAEEVQKDQALATLRFVVVLVVVFVALLLVLGSFPFAVGGTIGTALAWKAA